MVKLLCCFFVRHLCINHELNAFKFALKESKLRASLWQWSDFSWYAHAPVVCYPPHNSVTWGVSFTLSCSRHKICFSQFSRKAEFNKCDVLSSNNRDVKQIATAISNTAVVDVESWGIRHRRPLNFNLKQETLKQWRRGFWLICFRC